MPLLDLSHTSHTRAQTGIQRVCRALQRELGPAATPITWDPYADCWRPLDAWEEANLAATAPAAKRGSVWPLAARWRGRLRRLRGAGSLPPADDGLIVPELFSPAVAAALPRLVGRGPRVALFHDAIALRLPELSPPKTVARFPAYLQELRAFDGVAAVSEDSKQTLLDYWHWLGWTQVPAVAAIPLGLDLPPTAPGPAPGGTPVVLSVGSIEGRKNHLALLEAAEQLWQGGRQFSLHLVGLAQRETGRSGLERIAALQAAGRPLRYSGAVDGDALEAAYAACTFTVYPSLMEGFGLPVFESLGRHRPCICSRRGALGEAARGGGVHALDEVTSAALAAAIGGLLDQPDQLARLTAEARARPLRRWADYVRDLRAWMATLG
ncbi:MAG: glycosyltransferase [Cephaloticoccus sp.]